MIDNRTDAPWLPPSPWTYPGGQLVARYDAPREDWLAVRRAYIGASELARIFNEGKWGDAWTVWAEKNDLIPDRGSNRAQKRGLLFEDRIVELWAEFDIDFPIQWRRRGFMASRHYPHLGASIDFGSCCPEGRCSIEVKSQADTSKWEDDEIPDEYLYQILQQLLVTGRDHVHILALGHSFTVIHRVVYLRDVERLMHTIAAKAEAWWEHHITEGNEPVATHQSADALNSVFAQPDEDKVAELPEHLWDAAERKAALDKAIADLTVERDTIIAQVKQVAGDASVIRADGLTVATWNFTKKVNGATDAWRKAHPDLTAPYMEPVPTLNVKRLVADHPELLTTGQLYQGRTLSWK